MYFAGVFCFVISTTFASWFYLIPFKPNPILSIKVDPAVPSKCPPLSSQTDISTPGAKSNHYGTHNCPPSQITTFPWQGIDPEL